MPNNEIEIDDTDTPKNTDTLAKETEQLEREAERAQQQVYDDKEKKKHAKEAAMPRESNLALALTELGTDIAERLGTWQTTKDTLNKAIAEPLMETGRKLFKPKSFGDWATAVPNALVQPLVGTVKGLATGVKRALKGDTNLQYENINQDYKSKLTALQNQHKAKQEELDEPNINNNRNGI